MKKLYTLMMCGVFALSTFAQNTTTPSGVSANGRTVQKNMGFNESKFRSNKNKTLNPNTASSQSVWFNYAIAMDSLNGHVGSTNGIQANYLFWDSLPLGNFGNVYAAPWINNLGNVVDLTSQNLEYYGGIPSNWGTFNSYTVDSMSIVYAYTRNFPNPSIVDTLVVKLYTNATPSNFATQYFAQGNIPTNYGTDTLTMKVMKYSYQTNSPNATGVMTYKIPLTVADTAITFYREKYFSTNMFPVPSGNKIFASSITFKPGYAYSLGDTLDTELNAFYFTAWEENGAGTYPYFQDCNLGSSACDYNASGIVRTQERYNLGAPGWNGYWIPKYAFTAPYSLENHLISYKVTSSNVSVNDLNSGVSNLYQNQPNPFNGNTTIGYELINGGNVSLDIFDVTGKKVNTFNEGKQAAGKYAVEMNGSSLQPGVYFYTLTVDGIKTTKKMTVIK
jgi:hypothetical protein